MIKTNTNISRSDFISENLSEAICIARGCYADVFEKGEFAYRIWKKDVGYERYLSFLKKTKFRSSFVPKVYEHIIGIDFQCVRMELLKSHTEFQGPHTNSHRDIHSIFASPRSKTSQISKNEKRSVKRYRDSLHSFCEGHAIIFDLHSFNVLYRENGDFVITDPIAPSLSSTFSRDSWKNY